MPVRSSWHVGKVSIADNSWYRIMKKRQTPAAEPVHSAGPCNLLFRACEPLLSSRQGLQKAAAAIHPILCTATSISPDDRRHCTKLLPIPTKYLSAQPSVCPASPRRPLVSTHTQYLKTPPFLTKSTYLHHLDPRLEILRHFRRPPPRLLALALAPSQTRVA